MSFDALQEEEKYVFFLTLLVASKDINRQRSKKYFMLINGDIMKDQIIVLLEKSLIKISEYGYVALHDLVEDMKKKF
ncbi:functional resistance protein KR1, putative [Medicago truncatula]|uniref:Functional resistance protein KR1, putative n=1 Tax=Medicago truncatula TaxID=3880 RepID=G7JWD5_MEDTR|nr:functional resistance protein KR1, putative [Medicago truncatula]